MACYNIFCYKLHWSLSQCCCSVREVAQLRTENSSLRLKGAASEARANTAVDALSRARSEVNQLLHEREATSVEVRGMRAFVGQVHKVLHWLDTSLHLPVRMLLLLH
jgi:hypothetical protein